MSLTLPESVENYIRHSNAYDADGAAECFSADAQVRDDGKVHGGRDAIRAWISSTNAEYAATNTPVACDTTAAGCVVTSEVAGNFRGSPLRITFNFTLGANAINALEITA